MISKELNIKHPAHNSPRHALGGWHSKKEKLYCNIFTNNSYCWCYCGIHFAFIYKDLEKFYDQ